MDEWIKKMGSIHTMEQDSAFKRQDALDTCYDVDEP